MRSFLFGWWCSMKQCRLFHNNRSLFFVAFFLPLLELPLPFFSSWYLFSISSASSSMGWSLVRGLEDKKWDQSQKYLNHSLRVLLKVSNFSQVLWSLVYPSHFVRNSNSPFSHSLTARSFSTTYSFSSSNNCWYFSAVSLDILSVLISCDWAFMRPG